MPSAAIGKVRSAIIFAVQQPDACVRDQCAWKLAWVAESLSALFILGGPQSRPVVARAYVIASSNSLALD